MSKEDLIPQTKAAAVTAGGSFIAIVGGLTMSEIGMIFGIVLGALGFIVQAWSSIRRDRREQMLLEAQLRTYDRRRPNPPEYHGPERRVISDRRFQP